MEKNELVRTSPIFADLAPASLERLLAALVPRRLEKDELLYQRGDEALAFYGVAEGRIRFSAGSVEGKEVVLDFFNEGRWFGEIGLFDGGPRVVDARAMEETRVYVLPRRDLLALCDSDPRLLLRFVELFSKRIRAAEDIIIDASFLGLPARLAKKLLLLANDPARAETTADGPAIRIAQDELGRLAGVTRESAGKQLKNWEREGIVSVDYGKVVLRDVPRLRRIVQAAIGE